MARKTTTKPIEPEVESLEAPRAGDSAAIGGKPITKAEAIRRALAEGLTRAEDAIPFLKSTFGHDVTPGHFAASKSREKPAGSLLKNRPTLAHRGNPRPSR